MTIIRYVLTAANRVNSTAVRQNSFRAPLLKDPETRIGMRVTGEEKNFSPGLDMCPTQCYSFFALFHGRRVRGSVALPAQGCTVQAANTR